jgi:hypothetical protein
VTGLLKSDLFPFNFNFNGLSDARDRYNPDVLLSHRRIFCRFSSNTMVVSSTNLTYNSSVLTANKIITAMNSTAESYSQEQGHAAIYVVVVIVTYACSIFALLTLVLCKKKPEILHTDRDVNRFLRGMGDVRVALRRLEQETEVNKLMREISASPAGEIFRTLSLDTYLEKDKLSSESEKTVERHHFRRANSEGGRRPGQSPHVPNTLDAGTSDSTSLARMLHTVCPPSYEEANLISIGGGRDRVGRTNCKTCSCGRQTQTIPASGTELVLVHKPSSSEASSDIIGDNIQPYFPKDSERVAHHYRRQASAGRTRIPGPMVKGKSRCMPHIEEGLNANFQTEMGGDDQEDASPPSPSRMASRRHGAETGDTNLLKEGTDGSCRAGSK